jgi:hypothetical protein
MLRLPYWLPLCTALLLLSPGVSQARRQSPPRISGIITDGTSAGDPHLLVIESENETIALRVTRKTDVSFSPPGVPGDAVPLLETGRQAEAVYDRQTHVALSVKVSQAPVVTRIHGTLTAVGPGSTVTLNPFDPETQHSLPPVDLPYASESRFYLGTTPIQAYELPLLVGYQVNVLQSLSTLAIVRLRADVTPFPPAAGTVRGVNLGARTLRVALSSGVVDLYVPSGLDIHLGNLSVPLSVIQAGDWVRVAWAPNDSGGRLVMALDLFRLLPRTVSGRLAEVDPVARTITLAGRNGATFLVAGGAPITLRINDEPATATTLAELEASLSQFAEIEVQIEYLVRGKTRIATRVTAAGEQPTPPGDPARSE